MTTPYDRVAYPTAVFTQTHPERLGILAKLAGLEPVEPKASRILEIGGGNCMNLISIASALPECEAHGFDLSSRAIAKGQSFIDAAGMGNVHLAVEDIMTATRRYPARSFDYIIMHGVYAWVPPEVRRACMALVGHALSDRGVAFISYNCMPGGHIRLVMREMLLAEVGHIADPEQKIDAARTFLEVYAKKADGDHPFQTVLREHAGLMLERPDSVLFHDELGDCYYPQKLQDVVNAGKENGLRFLTDAGRNLHLYGFVADSEEMPQDPEASVVAAAVRNDYAALRFFRQTAFVRAEQTPDRALDVSRIQDLYLTTKLVRQQDGSFLQNGDHVEIKDEGLAAAIEAAAKASPQRTAVSTIAQTPEQLRVILQLFNEWYVKLHFSEAAFANEPGEFPQVSPLVRGMMEMGELTVCNLNHDLLKIEQPSLRALLMAADGRKSIAEIANSGHGIPPEQVPAALKASAERALLMR